MNAKLDQPMSEQVGVWRVVGPKQKTFCGEGCIMSFYVCLFGLTKKQEEYFIQ